MMKVLLILFAFLYPDSHQQCLSGYETPNAQQVVTWNRAQGTFAVDLFKIISNTFPRDNVVFSPYSIYHTLLLVYFGSNRQTEVAWKKTLRIPNTQNRNQTWQFYQYDQYLFHSSSKGYTMKTAEKLYFSLRYDLRPCMDAMFQTQLEKVSGSAVNIVNNWVDRISNGIITKLLTNLDPMTPVTATYLKENWAIGFRAESVSKQDFQITRNKKVKTDMMYNVNDYETGYSDQLKAFTIILPFEGRDSAMILLLPESQNDGSVNDMIRRLNFNSLNYLTNRTRYRAEAVSVILPKFTATKRINLREPLQKMGAMDSFVNSADYSRFTGKREVFVQNLIHQSAFEVAAEHSDSDSIFPRANPPTRFLCNRPFVYLVIDFAKCKLLLMGIYRKPEIGKKPEKGKKTKN